LQRGHCVGGASSCDLALSWAVTIRAPWPSRL
jgi:hypothetical protein